MPVILAAFTLLGLFYDLTVPFFEKPDELKHFAVIQYIQTWRRLPVVREGVYRPWDQEGTQPPLYHLLAAALVSWLDLSDFMEPPRNPHYADERSFVWRERGNNNLYLHPPGEVWSLEPVLLAARLARWLSLLAGLGTVALTYRLARLVFSPESPWLPLSAAGLVAFIPQFVHTSSAITNDSLAATLAAAALVLLAYVIRNGSSNRDAIYLGIVLGLGAITKLSLLYLLPLTALALLLGLRHRSGGQWLRHGAIIGGVSLLLAGGWYWRNWQLYGDFTALNAHLLYRGGALDPRPTLAQIWQTELTGLELSFWGAFGAGQILLEPWLYEALRWLKYVILGGLTVGLWRNVRLQVAGYRLQVTGCRLQVLEVEGQGSGVKGHISRFTFHVLRFTFYVLRFTQHAARNTQFITLALLAFWSVIIFVALLRWMQITPASWGRLLYPALPALAVLTVWGLAQFTIHHASRPFTIHHASRPFAIHNFTLPLLLVLTLFSLALISPVHYLQAAYAKPPLITETEIPPAGLERLDFTYAGALRLLGYQVQKTSVRPGEWLPVTLYWQALRPLDKNYSVFVHLLGRDNAVIGQANTYPDGGNWPTSMLEPGKVLKDTYYVPISPEAATPAVIRLALGVFEFEDPNRAAKAAANRAGEPVEPIVGAIPLLPDRWPTFNPAHVAGVNFGEQIQLAGYDGFAGEKVKPGTPLALTFYWESLAAPDQNLTLFIHLVNPASGALVAGFDAPPDFPTAFWQPGYRIEDTRLLTLPENLPAAEYEVRIGWYNPETLARLPLAGNSGDAWLLLMIRVTP
ncbi:MAG: hypothetical protein AB1801_00285 [Chloroflexota bacterium]